MLSSLAHEELSQPRNALAITLLPQLLACLREGLHQEACQSQRSLRCSPSAHWAPPTCPPGVVRGPGTWAEPSAPGRCPACRQESAFRVLCILCVSGRGRPGEQPPPGEAGDELCAGAQEEYVHRLKEPMPQKGSNVKEKWHIRRGRPSPSRPRPRERGCAWRLTSEERAEGTGSASTGRRRGSHGCRPQGPTRVGVRGPEVMRRGGRATSAANSPTPSLTVRKTIGNADGGAAPLTHLTSTPPTVGRGPGKGGRTGQEACEGTRGLQAVRGGADGCWDQRDVSGNTGEIQGDRGGPMIARSGSFG
ncbi:uncharacterized protein [Vicugna pacos]|uniref:Uncharacterized protein isoform X9 n=1 Tax=Vicugna pacos TaxID=30538 RepID=A0ABM5CK63_VICPA